MLHDKGTEITRNTVTLKNVYTGHNPKIVISTPNI